MKLGRWLKGQMERAGFAFNKEKALVLEEAFIVILL